MPNKDKATDNTDNPFYYKRLRQKEMMNGHQWRSQISRTIATSSRIQSPLCDLRRLPNPSRTLPLHKKPSRYRIPRIIATRTGEEQEKAHFIYAEPTWGEVPEEGAFLNMPVAPSAAEQH